MQEASWQGLSFSLANPPNWSSWAMKHTCTVLFTYWVQKQTCHGDFFARPAPPPTSYLMTVKLATCVSMVLQKMVSRPPSCNMQCIFWVHGLPLARLKRTCLARAIESMLQLVQKRGLFSLCSACVAPPNVAITDTLCQFLQTRPFWVKSVGISMCQKNNHFLP